ncbi:Immunoglobulin superfamily member 10-like [Homarus americanus]|uniref:Immunoglobulin superfamily member 10-like n=1 Tax=Homarus americanus TaxID=6706 RepID=A0A8J5NCP7_HOMAM|nr:Immunoglobulin superfamily member 10-like [Homarus americanus]
MVVVWVRSRDISIVAVGPFIYAPTDRFQVVHEEGSPDHQLKIRMVEERDQGAYACQMSLEPLVVHKIWLSMEEVGGPSIVETHSTNVTVEEGGTAILNCRVKNLGDATVSPLSSLPPTGVEEEEPGGPIIVETHSTNVTVEEGDTAILNCRVDNLGTKKGRSDYSTVVT